MTSARSPGQVGRVHTHDGAVRLPLAALVPYAGGSDSTGAGSMHSAGWSSRLRPFRARPVRSFRRVVVALPRPFSLTGPHLLCFRHTNLAIPLVIGKAGEHGREPTTFIGSQLIPSGELLSQPFHLRVGRLLSVWPRK